MEFILFHTVKLNDGKLKNKMTREEAIEQFQNCIELIKHNGKDWLDDRDIPVLNMAIEALEIQDLCAEMLESAKPVSTDDLISRQDAIDVVAKWMREDAEGEYDKETVRDWPFERHAKDLLESLPSADRSTGWIPVTKDGKNFPPYSEFILVWVNYGFEIASYEYDLETGADFWHMDFYDLYGENIWEVKAWCPLPEPYREDGEA